MTTNIDINPDLIEEAMQVSGHRTKKAVVNQALEEFVRRHKQQGILEMFGQVDYDEDPNVQAELIARTRQGHADADAGRVRDGRAVMNDLAKKHGLTPPR